MCAESAFLILDNQMTSNANYSTWKTSHLVILGSLQQMILRYHTDTVSSVSNGNLTLLTAPTSYIASSKTCYSHWLLSSSRTRIYIGTLFCKGIPIMPSTIATYILPQFECIPWLWSVIIGLMCWLSTYKTRLQVWPDLIFVWGTQLLHSNRSPSKSHDSQ